MTLEQLQWVRTRRAMRNQRPDRASRQPQDPLRKLLYNLVTTPSFEHAVMVVIVLNISAMACDYWGIEQQPEKAASLEMANSLFAYAQ